MYIEMLPEQIVPMRQKIIDSYKQPETLEGTPQQDDPMEMVAQMSPEMQQQFMALPPEEQQALLQEFMAQGGA